MFRCVHDGFVRPYSRKALWTHCASHIHRSRLAAAEANRNCSSLFRGKHTLMAALLLAYVASVRLQNPIDLEEPLPRHLLSLSPRP